MGKKRTHFDEEMKGFRAPKGTKARIEALAQKFDSTTSQIMRNALREYLERHETKTVPVISEGEIPHINSKKSKGVKGGGDQK